VENFHESRTARVGLSHSDLQHLHFMQDRGPTRLVGDFDVYPIRKLHHRDHSLHRLAKSFAKGVGFGLGLVFLSFIFYPILGFGSAQYQGPSSGR
jgi:hypothetical protein